MFRAIPIIFSLLHITGCTINPHTPKKVDSYSAEQLSEVANKDLCRAFAYSNRKTIRDEIESRGLVSEEGWTRIKEYRVSIGANVCELYAMRGLNCYPTIELDRTETRRKLSIGRCKGADASFTAIEDRITEVEGIGISDAIIDTAIRAF